MPARATAPLRLAGACLRLLLALTLLLGVAYPGAVLLAGRLVPERADGSPVRVDGAVVGSALLGQAVPDGPDGDAWFHPRPSAAGDGYDPLASGASNLGPSSPELLALVEERRTAVAAREGVDPAAVPPDAVTSSGSGLDPHVSPEYAALQVPRVARERGLAEAEVRALVEGASRGRALGFVGEPVVDVLALNVALEDAAGPAAVR
ncbi:potassium-transporting ATPase subunit KdpC [Pseudokineococcus marinus]|uniref:Potassium-transporting ATPase KdpC subunit n=1 Tax=Pseudokineococcus marinus TaxID=351215 RepID=A0A849BKE3_9ACTN|nr:potassium-transporting ATPase subunit KdpC [Pseudokineococcus marinus]NNH23670.1 potassium-transporting ATPase subunit KdpC [Pseudokineococcus marinus]